MQAAISRKSRLPYVENVDAETSVPQSRAPGVMRSWFVLAPMALLATSCARTAPSYPDAPARERPISVPLRPRALVEFADEEWRALLARFTPRVLLSEGAEAAADSERKAPRWACSPAICSHCLRIRGLHASFADELLPTGAEVLRALTHASLARSVFGADLLAVTRYGARFRPASGVAEMRTRADASHLDDSLASLLEIGVPLSTTLDIDGQVLAGSPSSGPLTLEAVLADTVANFNLFEFELEWTAVALALSLPPTTTWRNRYGETFSFDDLAERLMERDFTQLSCGGTHVFHALVVVDAVDAEHAILSDAVSERVDAYIERLLVLVRRNQRADGSWDLSWFRDAGDAGRAAGVNVTLAMRLLATGHLGECLLRLHEPHHVEDDVLRRAGQWLRETLPQYVEATRMHVEYCPITHAGRVLGALRRTE